MVWCLRGLTYEEANERYNDGITWKREVHKKFGTRLIELSSADFAYEKARQRLKRELVAAGVPIREVRSDELFDRILPENRMRDPLDRHVCHLTEDKLPVDGRCCR